MIAGGAFRATTCKPSFAINNQPHVPLTDRRTNVPIGWNHRQ
jgi:hypothetical protein